MSGVRTMRQRQATGADVVRHGPDSARRGRKCMHFNVFCHALEGRTQLFVFCGK